MSRLNRFLGFTALLTLAACLKTVGDAEGRRPVQSRYGQPYPWTVEVVGSDGSNLPTFNHRGRLYVMGEIGERYSIRVRNPTGQRVEAVLSVDGLDAIDGRTADYARKRGYIVPAYGELVLDGYRTSLDSVATFRFSSVRDSYAARKGQPRNIGVIGVAIFTERVREPVYLPEPEPYQGPRYDRESGGAAPSAAPPRSRGEDVGSADEAAPAGGGSGRAEAKASSDSARRPRPGLGTEFGERRDSRVSYVEFERANPGRPAAIAELRYNDRDGLIALGVPIPEPVPYGELELRESADPFPGNGFATPPPRR